VPAVNDVALLRRRQDQLAALRSTTADQLGRRWQALPAYTSDMEDRWVELAAPVVAAGQTRAAALQIAYLQRRLGVSLTFDRAAVLSAAKIDISQPFIALANALSGGADLDAAVESGRARAEGVGESAVQWASRSANHAAGADQRIVGWTRTLDAGACEWCQVVATQRYNSAESASFGHLRCGCGVDPIIGENDPGQVLNEEHLAELRQSGAVTRASEARQRGRDRARTAP
jgi:hypothetical protein